MRRELLGGAVGRVDFEFAGDGAGAGEIDIGHRDQPRVRNRAAQIFGVAAAHLAYSDHAHV